MSVTRALTAIVTVAVQGTLEAVGICLTWRATPWHVLVVPGLEQSLGNAWTANSHSV